MDADEDDESRSAKSSPSRPWSPFRSGQSSPPRPGTAGSRPGTALSTLSQLSPLSPATTAASMRSLNNSALAVASTVAHETQLALDDRGSQISSVYEVKDEASHPEQVWQLCQTPKYLPQKKRERGKIPPKVVPQQFDFLLEFPVGEQLVWTHPLRDQPAATLLLDGLFARPSTAYHSDRPNLKLGKTHMKLQVLGTRPSERWCAPVRLAPPPDLWVKPGDPMRRRRASAPPRSRSSGQKCARARGHTQQMTAASRCRVFR